MLLPGEEHGSYAEWSRRNGMRRKFVSTHGLSAAGQTAYGSGQIQIHHAARWSGKAQAAYLAAGRDKQWHSYLADLLHQHGCKRSLVPLLEK